MSFTPLRRRTLFTLLAVTCLLAIPAAPAVGAAPQSAAPPAAGAPQAAGKTQTAAPQPQLVVDSTSLDLGQVPEGEEVTAEFVIKNAGEAELKILKAKPS